MSRVHLFIDNLNIGGFQRLCQDQAYVFSELGYKVEIHSLSELPTLDSRNFVTIESDLIRKFDIKVDSISTTHLRQIINTKKILNSASLEDILISHSLRATVIVRISIFLSRSKLGFLTQIHQLPTLSAPIQRLRRFLYAQQSPVLVAYSTAVKSDWDLRVGHFPRLARPLFSKPIEVIRNGVYLNRLPSPVTRKDAVLNARLVFLGRNTGWKGISTFLKYSEQPKLSHFRLLLMLPEIDSQFRSEIQERFGSRVELVVGKSISSFKPHPGDVHFYAAQYGSNAHYIESISLNCLEMAAVGVPSVVTSGGLGTWLDLQDQEIFFECDWSDIDTTVEKILKASEMQYSTSALESIRNQVNIEANVKSLIRRLLNSRE